MKSVFAGALLLLSAALLAACHRYPDRKVSTGEPCESLGPLLDALPADKRMDGVPLMDRGCYVANAGASMAYAPLEGRPSYVFNIFVIDEKSKYLESFTAKGRDFMTGEAVIIGVTLAHETWERRWNDCKQGIVENKDHMKAIVARVGEFDICLYGWVSSAQRHLQAFALRGGLRYELTLNSEDTETAFDTERALRLIAPAFERFKPEALR